MAMLQRACACARIGCQNQSLPINHSTLFSRACVCKRVGKRPLRMPKAPLISHLHKFFLWFCCILCHKSRYKCILTVQWKYWEQCKMKKIGNNTNTGHSNIAYQTTFNLQHYIHISTNTLSCERRTSTRLCYVVQRVYGQFCTNFNAIKNINSGILVY